MDKNSPAMTSDAMIHEASDLCDRMEDDEKYSSGEAVMILNAAQIMMVQRQMANRILPDLKDLARKKNAKDNAEIQSLDRKDLTNEQRHVTVWVG